MRTRKTRLICHTLHSSVFVLDTFNFLVHFLCIKGNIFEDLNVYICMHVTLEMKQI